MRLLSGSTFTVANFFLAVTLAMACGGEATPPSPVSAALGDEVTLAPGGAVLVDDVTLTFVRIERDSRCPSDVTCIRAGEALVAFVLEFKNETQNAILEMPPAGEASLDVGELTVRGVTLDPQAVSTREIAQGDYRLTVAVTRRH